MATGKLSRRKLADYAADQLAAGAVDVLDQLAAYLIHTGRTRESELLVRDLQLALIARGTVSAVVTSARPLSQEAKADIEQFIRGRYEAVRSVELIEQLDAALLGGARLDLPDATLDATMKTKLENLTV